MRIEINLRLPSMVIGRKGFERIRWAFKNVLNDSVTWLFRDCSDDTKHATEDQESKSIAKLHPLPRSAHPPVITDLDHILVPDLSAPPRDAESSSRYLRSDTCQDIQEWLSLVAHQSPRINSTDKIDPYLCRYAIPNSNPDSDSGPGSSITVTTIRWHGFIPAAWLCRIVSLCASILQAKGDAWFAISAQAMKLELGTERHDGWCMLYPTLSQSAAVTVIADSSMEVEACQDQVAATVANSAAGGGGRDPVLRSSRDFVIWDFVDCVTER